MQPPQLSCRSPHHLQKMHCSLTNYDTRRCVVCQVGLDAKACTEAFAAVQKVAPLPAIFFSTDAGELLQQQRMQQHCIRQPSTLPMMQMQFCAPDESSFLVGRRQCTVVGCCKITLMQQTDLRRL